MGLRLILNRIPLSKMFPVLKSEYLLLQNVVPVISVLTVGPFRRMRYEEAIDWLASHDPPVLNKEGQPHIFGMDIEEGDFSYEIY
jgi:hypothetical protein